MPASTEVGKKLLISAIFHDFRGFETQAEVSEAEKGWAMGRPTCRDAAWRRGRTTRSRGKTSENEKVSHSRIKKNSFLRWLLLVQRL